MNKPHIRLVKDGAPSLKSDQVFFNNLNLNIGSLKKGLIPIVEMICNRIEYTYKSPAKINYVGASVYAQNKILNCMQYDEICLKFWHVESGLDIFFTFSARFARTLLIRLLSTSLIDESNSLPLSSTEKGIFSFIVARLLFDVKSAFADKMPDVKLLGIYHNQDEALAAATITGFGIYNFSFSFAADIYPITIAVPKELFKAFQSHSESYSNLLARSGHIKRPFILCLKTLKLDPTVLRSLTFGDLVLFEQSKQELFNYGLHGPLHAYWEEIAFSGNLVAQNGQYYFCLTDTSNLLEDCHMEDLEISFTKEPPPVIEAKSNNEKLTSLVNKIRVALSIEIGRLPMTLNELSKLKEGEVIDLQRKIDDPLEMIIENKVIGYCQPVQIDGRLGIRVIEILGEMSDES